MRRSSKIIPDAEISHKLREKLKKAARKSFRAAYEEAFLKCPFIDSMVLLKHWAFHSNHMVNLFRNTAFVKHDNLYNKDSLYLRILYRAFVDFCLEEERLKGIKDITLSVFKGKLNCARSEKRRNMTYEEKRDRLMLAMMIHFKDYYKEQLRRRALPDVKSYQLDSRFNPDSERVIVNAWLHRLGSDAYRIGSGAKKYGLLKLNELIVDDFEFVLQSLITGSHVGENSFYEDGAAKIKFPSVYDVIISVNKGGTYPDSDLFEKDLRSMLIKCVYWVGFCQGLHNGSDGWC